MVKYVLNSNIALRSWWLVPHAYYVKGIREAAGLKAEEFAFLSACDGQTELQTPEEGNALARKFLEMGMIAPAGPGETATPWSRPRVCDNRYFPAMNWMITGRCNYNCLHCFNAVDNAPLASEFTLEEGERLIEQAAECGINAFTVTGGEPMCHRHFFDFVESIHRHGMFVEELNTNGFYVNQEALDRLKAIGCAPLMKISLDGLGHHDWLRNRKGAEADALRAIRLCVENGFRVKVQTNVHRWNLEAMLPTAEYLDSLGVQEMRVIRTTEVPRWNENAKGATLGLAEYYDAMIDLAAKYARGDHQMTLTVWQLFTLWPEAMAYSLTPVACQQGKYRDSIPVCKGNRGMVAVAANGNVFPCMQMSGYYEAHGDILGNVKTDGLAPLLRGGRYLSEICTTVGQLARTNEKCGSCKYFPHCTGGCRAIALTLTGDKLGIDPAKCLFFEQGFYQKLCAALEGFTNTTPIDVD